MTFVQKRNKEKDPCLTNQWRIGEYVRLSKEDGDKTESDSIQNQKRIIDNHIEQLRNQGEQIAFVEVYSDDGYAGGNFERPGYRRMIKDIEEGTLNCIIFKDNSRLGRNYPELGRLMEEYFPQKGVRVISVLNNLDSVKDPRSYCSAVVSFSNIVNDDYIRQLSIKIRSTLAMKRERGEFIGNYAPYGYIKSPQDRHRLEIDPQAAAVVRMIFDWYAGGMSAGAIVKQLNALHILPPSLYKAGRGYSGFADAGRGLWALTTVNSILRNEVYIGNIIQGKSKSVSYRSKKMVPADESEWIVAEGMHEAIISDEQFALVRERICRRTRAAPNKSVCYLLSGFMRCAHCGGRMNRHLSRGYARYRCITRAYAPEKCSCPSVKEELLEEIILETIQRQIEELVDAEAVFGSAKKDNPKDYPQRDLLWAINQAEREKQRLERAKFRLYDDLQKGILQEEEYDQFRKQYNGQILRQDAALEQLRNSLSRIREQRKQSDEFLSFFQIHGNIREIDREMLNQLLDHVEFSDTKHLDIYFKFSSKCEKTESRKT